MSLPGDAIARLEQAAGLTAPSRARRMLVIANPHAATMSDRLKHLVIYALQGRYEVEAVDTQRKGHAIELCREAAQEGYDVVLAFGGDGTVNEVANGLAGTLTPMACLPGGSNNVFCKILGMSGDLVDATERLLGLADAWAPRPCDLGRLDDRWFTFSAGVGLDASVVDRVDHRPRLKARFGSYYFAQAGVSTFLRRYLVNPPRLRVRAGGLTCTGVSAMVQNARPYTYFVDRPIELAEGTGLESGDLAGVVLTRSSPLDVPTVLWRLFSPHARVADHRHVQAFSGVDAVDVGSLDDRPLPLQVDGDFIGEARQARFVSVPAALRVLA
jgi:diacylglycerol kinase family enzyme